MKTWLAVALLSMGVCAMAQQDSTFKVKHTEPKKSAQPAKSAAPVGNTGNSKPATTAASKDLQAVERQAAKPTTASAAHGKATPTVKPVKDQPNPPINFNGKTGRTKSAVTGPANPDPLKGRLKEKGAH
jgi:hypothetical protein